MSDQRSNVSSSHPTSDRQGPENRPGYSKKMLITILVVLGICVALIVVPFDGEMEEPADGEPTVEQADQPQDYQEDVAAVGEPAQLGELEYRVDNVIELSERDYGTDIVSPGAGTKFVVVSFEVSNEGERAHTVEADYLQLRDFDWNSYRSSSAVNSALSMDFGEERIVAELPPGASSDMMTGFEVPEELVTQEFDIVIPEPGAVGDDTVEVRVRPEDISVGFDDEERV